MRSLLAAAAAVEAGAVVSSSLRQAPWPCLAHRPARAGQTKWRTPLGTGQTECAPFCLL